ncbi:MAG TPA: hypothetical protein VFZ24_05040 [Longimicrobiales bacterium]
MIARRVALLAASLACACTMDDDERRALMESSQEVNFVLARDTAVAELRAPSDTGRLVYDSAVALSRRAAAAAGAQQVWSPFGIATPDTVPPRTTR